MANLSLMSRTRTRPLFLHTSALSDAEYTVYVEALCDILDCPEQGGAGGDNSKLSDEELEARMVGMREARAWMRGRYRDVSVSDIDKILHFFKAHAQDDRITGGQYFAALRILMHLRSGSCLNEGLAYIQSDPSSPRAAKRPLTSNPNTYAIGLPTSDLPVTFSNQQTPDPFPPYPSSLSAPTTTDLLSQASLTTPFPIRSQPTFESSSLANNSAQPPSSYSATTSNYSASIRHILFSCAPAASSAPQPILSSSTSKPPTAVAAAVNSSEPSPMPTDANLSRIEAKLLELREKASVFASYEEMLEGDPVLVKDIANSFVEWKREHESVMSMLKCTHSKDAGSSSEKANGKASACVYSPVQDLRNKRRNTMKKTVRQLVRSRLREFTKNTNIEMSYANYETGIVHKYGIELAGWPLPTFALDRVSLRPLQGVVDGLANGSIRWAKLSDEQLADRIQAWKAKEDAGVQDETNKRKHAAVEDDSMFIITDGAGFRSAAGQMLERDIESTSASTKHMPV